MSTHFANSKRSGEQNQSEEARAPSASRESSSGNANTAAETSSLPRLRRETNPARRRCFRSARIRACLLQGDSHDKTETELRLLLAHRAGTGAEPPDR